ncbi:hypothetical protein DPMN_169992 [Dreissena polymorpha]|uniref:Uncharacterized protein n=1 Tax=Dreissena polymorpha TaxID=45954 RepID=A0A9D4DXS7_DREPO|nr:hypothetical protein DPMN_169992 [Dreissena polymorpha]
MEVAHPHPVPNNLPVLSNPPVPSNPPTHRDRDVLTRLPKSLLYDMGGEIGLYLKANWSSTQRLMAGWKWRQGATRHCAEAFQCCPSGSRLVPRPLVRSGTDTGNHCVL